VRAYRRLLLRLGRARWFSRLTWTVLVPIDRFLYSRTGGRVSLGHLGRRREGALQTLLLTTTGCETGRPRTAPVLYLEDGSSLVVVASNFGRDRHPAWSENLLADERASVQIRDSRRNVRARLGSEEEKARLWPALLELYPTWEAYTGRTDRSFRVFFLEPA
jgi:deazaflavin-dependent oxidoreductase (nitroreductase family)